VLAASNSGQATAIGFNSLAANTTGRNVGVGLYCLTTNTTGTLNNAFGDSALYYNTTGNNNTAVGVSALQSNTTASENTAVGYQAAYSNTTGSPVSALGYQSLYANTTGIRNTSIGYKSLTANTTGGENSTSGHAALYSNTTGSYNTAMGSQALLSNTTGAENTAVGYQAGYSVTTGYGNAFYGRLSGQATTGYNNTFYGGLSGYLVTSGNNNTILGRYNGNQGGLDIRTSSNYIVLSDGDGNPRARWDNNGQGFTVGGGNGSYAYQILNGGNSNPYGLYMQFTGASPNNTSQYFLACADSTTERFRIYSNGTYGSVSDSRLKKNIETSRGYLSDLCQLRVVKYGWNTNDDSVPKELGFIAQEVEEVFPSLVDNSGEYKMIKQPVLIPMLVKAIQEQQAIIETLTNRISALENK
jgi:hypothetical protein